MSCFSLFITAGFLLAVFCCDAYAQSTTEFTYQGELKQNGIPANGSFNFDFELWNAATGGSQIGSTNIINGVAVVDGTFAVDLDFGADAFDNADRWLRIRVNGSFLSPRQKINRTPYAIQTRGIFVNNDESFVGVGRVGSITSSEVFGIYSPASSSFGGMYANTSGANAKPFYGYSAGGDVDAYHYFNGATDKWHLVTGTTAMTVAANGDVGIGTTDPYHPLDVEAGGQAMNVFSSGWDALVSESGAPDGYGISGVNLAGGLAGYFLGNVHVGGQLSKSAGSFKIDHPLDPANKYLYHSFVESPDMMNIYNGNITTDSQGYATVQLPEWFEVLNRDFRYQLTVVDDGDSDDFVLAKVVQRIQTNSFKIRTSAANTEISWQVTGVRQDAYAEANRIPVEEDKVGHEMGHYLHPEVYGLDRDSSITAARQAFQEAAQEAEHDSNAEEENSDGMRSGEIHLKNDRQK